MKKFYLNFIFKYKSIIGAIGILIIILLSFNIKYLTMDASSETLLLENDKSLAFTREINEKYNSDNFLLITFSPKVKMLSEHNLNFINKISKELKNNIENIKSITSILNVPLLESPVLNLAELSKEVPTLLNKKDINKELVKKELLNSPLYKNRLVSSDFKTTAILLNLKDNEKYLELIKERNKLKDSINNSPNKDLKNQLKKVSLSLKKEREIIRKKEETEITKIREIIKSYDNEGELFLGGVNMISNDIISFIKNDITVYSSVLLIVLILLLWFIFKQFIWIFTIIFISTLSVISSTSVISLLNMEVTVISSNFISLQLIITMSILLHLIIRYKELVEKYKNSSHKRIVLNVVLSKLNPTFFSIITTIAGFGSLIFSNIKPVINLGIMMSISVLISLIICFLFFPIITLYSKKILSNKVKNIYSPVNKSLSIVLSNNKFIIYTFVILFIISLIGSSKLIVENSFISYFKKNTEIYQSMKTIDEKLGGTTPLDIIVDLKEEKVVEVVEDNVLEEEEDFDDFDEYEEMDTQEQYWFTKNKMDKILEIHDYLESRKEIGNVQSFGTILKIGNKLNDNKDLDSFKLALIYNEASEELKKQILYPYLDIPNNQLRFTVRIIDSNEKLRRNVFINEIKKDLSLIIKKKDGEVKLSNLLILYNNMLQSLFDSQIKTLFIVLIILFVMFQILFKDIKLSIIALITNAIPISFIFGFMGYFNIPLDVMTITIAAISIGIGVDDTIHYIHRFNEEFKKDHNYISSIERTHNSLGNAMYYTTLIIMIGFSILVFSNLIPTIYFGLLTMVTMCIVLISALILLPKLILIFKPRKNKKDITNVNKS